MVEHGFMKPRGRAYTVGELLAQRGRVPIISVSPLDKAEAAISLLRRHGISQMPVVESGGVVGCVRELTLARLLHSGVDPRQIPVREIMARPMPTVDEHVDLDEIYRLLSAGNSGVAVLRGTDIVGIVTRIDLVEFWDSPFHDEEEAPSEAARST
jgi:cystathionine beta-synthase